MIITILSRFLFCVKSRLVYLNSRLNFFVLNIPMIFHISLSIFIRPLNHISTNVLMTFSIPPKKNLTPFTSTSITLIF